MGIVMDIIDHGEWEAYKPENYPVKGLPSSILFARRVSDGRDWYLFARKELIGTDTIKVLLRKAEEGWVVITTTYDAAVLFPADSRLIEVSGVTADHESLRTNILDFDKRQFIPPPKPEDRPNMMKIIMEELGVDEAKVMAKLEAARKSRSKHG
jgi:hypothetical protein